MLVHFLGENGPEVEEGIVAVAAAATGGGGAAAAVAAATADSTTIASASLVPGAAGRMLSIPHTERYIHVQHPHRTNTTTLLLLGSKRAPVDLLRNGTDATDRSNGTAPTQVDAGGPAGAAGPSPSPACTGAAAPPIFF